MEDSQNLLTIIEFTDTVTESFPIEDYISEVATIMIVDVFNPSLTGLGLSFA